MRNMIKVFSIGIALLIPYQVYAEDYNPWYSISGHRGVYDCTLLISPITNDNATPDQIVTEITALGKHITIVKQTDELVAVKGNIGDGYGIFVKGKTHCEEVSKIIERSH